MTIYNIHFTKNSTPTINVDETNIDTAATDLKFFGRRRLQYGQDMNQNILFLLEHFACPEDAGNPGNPDLTIAVNPVSENVDFSPLTNPTDGQIWFNSTQQRPFIWDDAGQKWIPVGMQDDIAANWGIIYNGQQLPKPVSSKTGHIFDYADCSWIVSPYQFPQQIDYMLCDTDASATVSSLYTIAGDPTIRSGFATYLIVAIKGNINLGNLSPIPSNTPTPVLSPTPSTTPVPPTPTPTATPSGSPTYAGPLTAYFAPRIPMDGPFWAGAGTPQPYYSGDSHRIRYPGITDTKYKILYSSSAPLVLQTSPLAPHNPWDNVSGNYYIYIQNTPTAGTKGIFTSLNNLYHMVIFCSGKSTEIGTPMVDGIDGQFYRVSTVTNLGGGIVQLTLNVVPVATLDRTLWNHPPLQTSPIGVLKFNYDYVYATAVYLNNNTSLVAGQTTHASCTGVASTDPNAEFYFCPPTAVETPYDLYIQGGNPPYTIVDIRYANPAVSSTSSKVPVVSKTGFVASGSQYLPAPVSFTELIDGSPVQVATKPLFAGAVNFPSANTNIEQIPNGYAIRNYVATDFNYGTDYATKYGTGCKPEWFWHTVYSYPPGCVSGCTTLETTSCDNFTGFVTTIHADTFVVEVKDAAGTTVIAPLTYGLRFQTVNDDFMNENFFFNPSIASGPNSGSPVTAGTYTYGIGLNFATLPDSQRPNSSPAKLAYVFSLLNSPQGNIDPTRAGEFRYTGVTGTSTTSLMSRPTPLNCLGVFGPSSSVTPANALIHIGCDISNADSDLQCPSTPSYLSSYSYGPLTPGAFQQYSITKVWKNNGTPGVVDISATPIIVKFSVLSAPLLSLSNNNTYNWTSMTSDRSSNHSRSFTSPRVPYNMKIEVTIPAGLAFAGTLVIPFAAMAYDNPFGSCAIGTAGNANATITLNFANT